jgi:hypothetical protein
MEIELITALNNMGSNGLWAVFWYALFGALPDTLLIGAMIIGVRTLWKKNSVD